MVQPTELELRYVDVYNNLRALQHIFERRPPETEAMRGIFLRRAESLASSYDSFVSPEWKTRLSFNTVAFLRRIKSLDYSETP